MPQENLHDKLFKQTFSIRSEAKAFVQLYLPKWISTNLDYRSFKRSPDSFINEQLKEYFSDMVYTCKWKETGNIKITFLLEHKSYVPNNIFVQLLRYLAEAYDHQVRQKERFSLVIPVVIYHGKKTWNIRNFDSYFDIPDERLKKYLPSFDYELVDIMKISDDLLKSLNIGYFLRTTFFLLKHQGDKEIVKRESKEFLIFVEQEMSKEQRRYVLQGLLLYIFKAFGFEKQEFRNFTKNVSHMVDYIAGSLYDKLIKEGQQMGIESGMRKGMEKGLEKGMKKGLEKGLKEGLEKGLQTGLEKGLQTGLEKGLKTGIQKGKILGTVTSLLNILTILPTTSRQELVRITKMKKEIIEEIQTILSKEAISVAKKKINQLFFEEIKLNKEEKKEIDQLLKTYFSQHRKKK